MNSGDGKTRVGTEAGPCHVDVDVRGAVRGVASEEVAAVARVYLENMACGECELSLVLCDDSFIRELNGRFRHRDTPTDVLSFPGDFQSVIDAPVRVLGDVIISVETAAAQAAVKGHSLAHEVNVLLAHGVLHLLGYTHDTDETEAVMNARAQRLVSECTQEGGASV